MDYVYQKEENVDSRIKIIKIDEKTLERYGTFGTWSRQIYADLVNQLYENASPYVIGFDVLFTGEIDSVGDQAFSKACQQSDNVIVVNNIVLTEKLLKQGNTITGIDRMHVERIEQPYQSLKEVTRQGFSNAVLDDDGMIRKSLLNIPYENYYYDSFSTSVAKLYSQKTDKSFEYPQTDFHDVFGFQYTSKNHTYEEVSLVDVMDGKVDLRTFKDCVVLVGAHAPGMQDAFSVPIEYGKQMYGVEIHANIIESMMKQNTVLEINLMVLSVITFCFILLTCLIVYKCSLLKGGITLLMMSIVYVFICQFSYDKGLEIPIALIPISTFAIYVFNVFRNYLIELKQRKKTLATFKKYVAPQVVEQLMNKKDLHIDLSGELKDIAVMFVDIRGFTTLSERLEPKQIVDILNTYLNLTSTVIFENLGTLDKFIGDATMAVFNSPFDLDDYVYRAVKTAVSIAKGNQKIAEQIRKKYDVEVGFGIGVHCGDAVIGNIGSEKRLDFTAIGDTVNTASRLESNAKAGQVLVSEEIVKRLEKRIKVNCLGELSLKGKTQKMDVYEVVCLLEEEYYE